MSHYYTNESFDADKQFSFSYTYQGQVVRFLSSSGVFSKSGVDFGSHLLLNSLPNLEGLRILDVGCGVGVLGLLLAKAYLTSQVTLVDINERAVLLAQKNATLNNIKNGSIAVSNLYEKVEGQFDVIVSNPPIRAGKNIVHGIVIDGYSALKEEGKIYIVIQKKQGAPSMEKKMIEVFGNVEVVEKKNGYFVYCSQKM